MNTQSRLRKLRQRWKDEPENRKMIEYQAKLLKMGMSQMVEEKDPDLEEMIMETIIN